jgi:hypothetical protein
MLASSSLNIGRASVGCSRCAQQKAVATVVPVASRRLVNVPVQHETVARFDVACAAKSKASSGGKGFGASSKQSQPSAEPNQPCPCGSGATYGVSRQRLVCLHVHVCHTFAKLSVNTP